MKTEGYSRKNLKTKMPGALIHIISKRGTHTTQHIHASSFLSLFNFINFLGILPITLRVPLTNRKACDTQIICYFGDHQGAEPFIKEKCDDKSQIYKEAGADVGALEEGFPSEQKRGIGINRSQSEPNPKPVPVGE